jgi:hypothetical protein
MANRLFVHVAPVPNINYNYPASRIIHTIDDSPVAYAKAKETDELAGQSLDIVVAVWV